MYSFMGGGLFCAGVGNILLMVSTATDYWMQYRHSNNYMHQGLWRYCVPGKCMTHTDSIGKEECGWLQVLGEASGSGSRVGWLVTERLLVRPPAPCSRVSRCTWARHITLTLAPLEREVWGPLSVYPIERKHDGNPPWLPRRLDFLL